MEEAASQSHCCVTLARAFIVWKIFNFKMLSRFILYATVFSTSRVSAEIMTGGRPSASDVFFSYFDADFFPNDLRLSNNVGEVTVANILRHTRILLTDGTSNAVVRQVFTNIRETLTSENGGTHLISMVKAVGFVLRDENGAAFVRSACKLASAVARDQESTGKILKSVITSVMTVLSHENAQAALEGLAEGLKIYFQQLTEENVAEGIERLKMNRTS